MRLLNKSIVTFIKVDYDEFEKFVTDYYGFKKQWSLMVDQECGNDCNMTFDVDGRVDSYDEEQLIIFKTEPDQTFNITFALLNDFARKGLIDKGQYLIDVCW